MFSKIHSQFGTAGLILSVVAIVLALGGGAYAANNSATASKAGKPGPRGKTGATGPAGPQGTAGPTGPAGTNGTNGAPGEKGTAGANGKSVVASAAGGSCSKGGTKFEVEGSGKSEKVCNGETGFTETLPEGKTETGDFFARVNGIDGANVPAQDLITSSSFNIPLTSRPHIIFVSVGKPTPTGCLGNVENPGAEAGNLCIFAGTEVNLEQICPVGPETPCPVESVPNLQITDVEREGLDVSRPNDPGAGGEGDLLAGKQGFGMFANEAAEGTGMFSGDWAVTAPTE